MVNPARGEIWWARLAAPTGSGPGFERPVVVVSSDWFNESSIRTVVCAVVTSNLHLAGAPGNVLLGDTQEGLDRASVVNVSQVITLDKSELVERLGSLGAGVLGEVERGLRLVLDL